MSLSDNIAKVATEAKKQNLTLAALSAMSNSTFDSLVDSVQKDIPAHHKIKIRRALTSLVNKYDMDRAADSLDLSAFPQAVTRTKMIDGYPCVLVFYEGAPTEEELAAV